MGFWEDISGGCRAVSARFAPADLHLAFPAGLLILDIDVPRVGHRAFFTDRAFMGHGLTLARVAFDPDLLAFPRYFA